MDNYKEKHCGTLSVRMITEILHFNLLLWWLPWHQQLVHVLVFSDLDNLLWGKYYMCYDYVHLDTLSDISADRMVVKPQRTTM